MAISQMAVSRSVLTREVLRLGVESGWLVRIDRRCFAGVVLAAVDSAVATASQERLQLHQRMQMIETEEQLLEVDTQIQFRLAQGAACFVFALLLL